MKPVSNAYKQEMGSLLRNRSYVRVVFLNVDTEAAKDGEWSANGTLNFSEFATLDYDYLYEGTCATLELNRWALDGKNSILPDSALINDGFVSMFFSDANGDFSVTPTLTKEFTQPMTFPGLTLVFDTRTAEWVRSITANFYLEGSLVATGTVTVEDTMVIVNEKAISCDKIELLFGSTLPYRRPRLEQVLYGLKVQYENADIVSTTQSHDVDPLTRRLPQEKFEFTVLDYPHEYDPGNPSGVYAYIDKHAPISIQFGYALEDGSVEWLPADKYVLDGKPSAQKNQVTFSGTGLIGSLSDTFYKSKLGTKNFYTMAEEVLLDADLTLTDQGTYPWVIDESLKQMFTSAALPIDTHMNCLQLIAHACRCRLFTDDSNIIHIAPFDLASQGQTDFVLNFDSIAENAQSLSKIDQLKAVTVAKYSYTAKDKSESLYEGETSETELHVEFGLATNVEITVTGGTLLSSSIYARAADLVLSAGTKNITITGFPLSESSVVVSYPVSMEGEIDKEENPLITTDTMCIALANHVKNYLQLRSTYDCQYRGNPELEVGDRIELQTVYSPSINGLVLVDEISFDGSLSGKVTVKELT